MQNHTGCTCLSFLHCEFYNVSSICLLQRMHNHIGCICSTFRHCEFYNVSSDGLPLRMHNHIGCICLVFLHCVFSNVPSNCLPERMLNHIGCICLTFLCHLSLSLESHWLCFYLNLAVQDLGPFLACKKCAGSCNFCFQLICKEGDIGF